MSERRFSDAVGYKITGTLAVGTVLQLDSSECTTNETVLEQAGTTAFYKGVLAEATTSTKAQAPVWTDGDHYALVDGSDNAISVGTRLKTLAGEFIPAATNKDVVCAEALEATTSDSVLALVRLVSPYTVNI